MSKFSNVPVEDDTKILVSLENKLGERDVLYQKWFWDGITAESFIFVSDDVVTLSDADLEEEVRTSPMVKTGTSITVNRADCGFVFVNFNFVTDNEKDDYRPKVFTPEELEQKRMNTVSYIGESNRAAVENIKNRRQS